MKGLKCLIFVSILLLGSFVQLEAASLKVSPAGFIIHNVTPGKLYDIYKETGLRLAIYNDDEVGHSYILSTHRPSGRWEKGYLEIPDPSWCWFEKNEITVGPKERGYGNIYLKFPDEEKYYNQHWVATLGIAGKPGQRGISLAIDIRVQIETKSKDDIKGRLDGVIAFKPGTVRFENVCAGNTQKGRVVVYNNDDKAHTYTITSLLHKKETTAKTYLTRSYEVLPDPEWIVLNKENLRIEPHDASVLSLKAKIPEGQKYYGKKWEEILLVEPDEGLPGFIRVQIETKKNVD